MAASGKKLSDGGAGEEGGRRKVLPSLPSLETLSMAAPRPDAAPPAPPHCYAPHFFEYALHAEYALLLKERVSGIYVMPSATDPLLWHCVLFVRHMQYAGAVFRFSLHIPDNFPDGPPPRVVFTPPVWHPLIHPSSGEMDVARGFGHRWRPNVHHLFQVLLYVRRAFYKVETSRPLNPEAAILHATAPTDYAARAEQAALSSLSSLSPPTHPSDALAFRFSAYDESLHEPVRAFLKAKQKEATAPPSSSWVQPDTLRVLSRPPSDGRPA